MNAVPINNPAQRFAYFIANPDSRICDSIPRVGNAAFACIKFGHHKRANRSRDRYKTNNPSFFYCNIGIPNCDALPKSFGLWLQDKVLSLSHLRETGVFQRLPWGDEWFRCIGNDTNLRAMATVLSGGQNALQTELGNAIQAQIIRVNNFYQQNQQAANPQNNFSDYNWLANQHANLGTHTGYDSYQNLVANNTPQQLQVFWGMARPNIQTVVNRMAWFNVLEEAMRNLAARLRATQNFQPQINQPRRWDSQSLIAVLNDLGNILPDLVVHEAPLALSPRQNATTSANVKFLDNNVALLFFTHFLETN